MVKFFWSSRSKAVYTMGYILKGCNCGFSLQVSKIDSDLWKKYLLLRKGQGYRKCLIAEESSHKGLVRAYFIPTWVSANITLSLNVFIWKVWGSVHNVYSHRLAEFSLTFCDPSFILICRMLSFTCVFSFLDSCYDFLFDSTLLVDVQQLRIA